MVRQGLGVAIVNPLTALALSGPELLVRPLDVAIAYRVGLLVPQMAAPQPALAHLVEAIREASKRITTSLSL
jgi:DNA-binding transcriptional LysR family regulator